MSDKKILGLYGLKWNPFLPDVPSEALFVSPRMEHFGFRLENKVREGGFALITGATGTGKSVSLRILSERLGSLHDVTVGVVDRPQSGVSDFYREMGDLFGVSLGPRNRWGSFKTLRDRWIAHIDATLMRPVLLIDEAQDMPEPVFAELRTLASAHFDSRCLLTTVFCGDPRLPGRFMSDGLVALGSRIRPRLAMESATVQELGEFLRHALAKAGTTSLMTPELISTLAEHAAGNYRVLCGMAADLLAAGVEREAKQLDEKIFLEVFATPERARPKVVPPPIKEARRQ